MQKLILFFCFLFFSTVLFCQAGFPYQDIKLEKPSDYKETEPMALSAANFLLTSAFVEKDAGRTGAIQFLSNWMTGTKEFNFYLKGRFSDISSDRDLLGLYIAAMAKFCLENKSESVNPMHVDLNASKIVLAYCDDSKNNFKLKKKHRKILETNQTVQ